MKSKIRSRLNSSKVSSPFTIDWKNPEPCVKVDECKLLLTEDANFDFKHIFEEDFKEVVSFIELAKNKKCFFDIGGSRGVFSVLFNKINITGNTYAFEGSTHSCAAMQELSQKNQVSSRLKINECMVGDKNGKDLFSLESCGYVQVVENSSLEKVEKKIVTLDSFCNKHGLVPDLIKIDVEGYELEVLRGSQKILHNYSPILILELHLSYLDKRCIYPAQVLEFLIREKYQLFDTENRPISISKINSSIETTIHLIAMPS